MGWDAGGCHCPDNTYWLLVAAWGETCHKCRNWTVLKSPWEWDIEMTTQFVPTIFV